MSSFTVDNLFTAIKSLKQERMCLEQKLSEQRKRRENLERTMDAMTTKNGQLHDSKSKLKETLTVAQHKVAQTQAQAEKLQEQVDKKQKRLDALNTEMENNRKHEHEEAENISNQLSEVTDRLLQLRGENKEEYVSSMIGNYDQTITDSTVEMDKTEYEIKHLSTILDELHLKKDESVAEAERQGIPLWQQKMVLDMFHEKIDSLARSIDMFQAKKSQIEQEYGKVHAEKDRLSEELTNMPAL